MSIKFEGKKVQNLTDSDIGAIIDEPEETRRPVLYAHCLIIDTETPSILAAHYAKGMSGVIVQDTRRIELRLRIDPLVPTCDIRLAFSEKKPTVDENSPADIGILSISGTDHKFSLGYEEGGSVLYVTPIRKDQDRNSK